MWLGISFLLTQLIFYNQCEFSNALVGDNVRRAKEGEFPFIVSIKLINPNNPEPETNHGCTGAIITRTHVLSIAHQLEFVQPSKLEIIVGSTDIRSGQKFYALRITPYNRWAVKNEIPHNYRPNDLAIVELTQPIPNEIKAVIISPLSSDSIYGLNAVVAGWSRKDSNKIERFMYTAALKILTKLKCKKRVESISQKKTAVHDRYLCSAADPFVFIRLGDSGGPLLLPNGELVGINKGTSPLPENNFNPDKVNLHVIIDDYREFIQNMTGHFNIA